MFYHIQIGIQSIDWWLETNIEKEKLLMDYVCPFIEKEVTYSEGSIKNMSSLGNMIVFKTPKVVDSERPIEKTIYYREKSDGTKVLEKYDYHRDLINDVAMVDCTEEIFGEAIDRINNGYKSYNERIYKSIKSKKVFMICPFGETDIDKNYKIIIKPIIEKHQYRIDRVDEIPHTQTITSKIIEMIESSTFIIADLSYERPNCYYELGYAHALSKPVIILAKKGTKIHFDTNQYKHIFWDDDQMNLQQLLDEEIKNLINK